MRVLFQVQLFQVEAVTTSNDQFVTLECDIEVHECRQKWIARHDLLPIVI